MLKNSTIHCPIGTKNKRLNWHKLSLPYYQMGTWKHMAVLVQMVKSKIDHLYGEGFEVYIAHGLTMTSCHSLYENF
jgi:hypothetical protein